MTDINNHPLCNKFYKKLKENGIEMEEFTHKCWGPKEPGRKQKNVLSHKAHSKESSEQKRSQSTSSGGWGSEGIQISRECQKRHPKRM
jgi:hypothetical protein